MTIMASPKKKVLTFSKLFDVSVVSELLQLTSVSIAKMCIMLALNKCPFYIVAKGMCEKRCAHACLSCFWREFAIEIICDNKTN